MTEINNDRLHAASTSSPSSSNSKKAVQLTSSMSASSTVVGTVLAVAGGGGKSLTTVPLVKDTLTFEGRQATRLREMERRIESEMRRKKRDWEREVERMREEFLQLYPVDKVWGSDEMLNDPLVSRRCGSTDILDAKKMRTLFMDYPDSGRRYKLRFNVSGCDPKSVRVSTDGDRIVVRACRCSDDGTSREYCRKIQKPKDVDHTKFKAYLSSDSVLVVEAPVPPSSLNLRKAIHSPSHSHCGSTHSRSPSSSPAAGGPDTPSKEKIGVPIFRDENGSRRLHLVVDLGTTFRPSDITVQVIKDNRIQVRAKHEEKTPERLCKSKFAREYELGEKIETLSLTGGLASDGRLYVGAFAKGHGAADADADADDSEKEAAAETGAGDTSNAATASTDDNGETAQTAAPLQPCNVLAEGTAPAPAASSSEAATL